MGEVLAVGPGEMHMGSVAAGAAAMTVPQRIPLDVVPGDVVLIASHYAGQEIEVDGDKLLLVRASEIAGVIER